APARRGRRSRARSKRAGQAFHTGAPRPQPLTSCAAPQAARRARTGERPMSQELSRLVEDLRREESVIRQGGGPKAISRQHAKGRLTARERIAGLIDPDTAFFEFGLWAGWKMYAEWGGAPSAGVVTGLGTVSGRRVMVIANDATVKAGAFF